MKGKTMGWILLLASSVLVARGQVTYVDGVLSQSSDLTGCMAKPSPVPHMTPGGVRSVVNPETGADSNCSDLGSTYQIVSKGRIYGLKRTTADVRRDALLQALGNTPGPGVLAFQPTGLHVWVIPNGDQIHVKWLNRQSAYTILYTR